MTTLITGGGGYIGIILAEQLIERGKKVRAFDRFYFGEELLAPLKETGKLETVRGDVRKIDPSVFEGVDEVIELAGLSNDPSCDLDERLTEEINRDGSLRVARLAKEAGVKRFVFASSCSVYGAGEGILTETSERKPVSLYAKMKIAVEDQVMSMNSPSFVVTALRNATVYGLAPRMRFDLIVNLMTLSAFKNHKVYVMGGGHQWRPLVHVRDVGRAFGLVLDSDPKIVAGEVFNVGSDKQNYQVHTVASMVGELVPNTVIEVVPDDPDKRTYHVEFSKIRDVLGFQPKYDVQFAIQEIYDALRLGVTSDTIKTRTVAFYRYLLEAERLVNDLSIDGRIL